MSALLLSKLKWTRPNSRVRNVRTSPRKFDHAPNTHETKMDRKRDSPARCLDPFRQGAVHDADGIFPHARSRARNRWQECPTRAHFEKVALTCPGHKKLTISWHSVGHQRA